MTAPAGFVPDAPAGFVPDEAPQATPAPPETAFGKVARIAGEEAAKIPGKVKNLAQEGAEAISNPKLSTLLPLTLGPESTVLTRLATVAAGKMTDQPSTDWWENLKTAGKGLAGPAVMEAVTGAIPAAGKVFRSTAYGARKVAASDAANVGQAMQSAAPTLRPGTTANEMQRTAEGPGLARIGAGKELAVQDIETGLNAAPAQTPHFTNAQGQGFVRGAQPGQWSPARLQGEIPIPSMGKNMTLRDANAELSSIGDQMRGIKPLDPRFPKDADLKQEYGKLAEEIKAGIEQVAGLPAAAQWAGAQKQYRAGRAITNDLLERPTLFRQGQFNTQDLQRWLKDPEHRNDLARSLGGDLATGQNLGPYNRMVDAITRGAGAGMVDKMAGEAPGILSGKGSYGTWRAPAESLRYFFPNASSSYVGRVPYTPPPAPSSVRNVLDLAAQKATP